MRIIRRSRLLITRWLRKLRSKFFIQWHVFLKSDLPELWVLLSIKVQAQIKSIFHFLYKVFAKHQIILTDWQLEIFIRRLKLLLGTTCPRRSTWFSLYIKLSKKSLATGAMNSGQSTNYCQIKRLHKLMGKNEWI